jgi:hypothetical protein
VTIVDTHVSGGLEVGGDAPLAVTHGSGPQLSEIVLEMDLDNDGDFSEPEENLTGFLLTGESLSGRDRPSPVAGVAVPGTLRVQLNNDGDQFSRYNTASPFNAAPFSLQPGRRIRVRTAESVPDDPVLLARDRFNRPDGPLGTTETGQVWTNQQGSFTVVGQVASAAADFSSDIVSTVDVGVDDYYVQATLRQIPAADFFRDVGIVVRWTDIDNFTFVHYSVLDRLVRIRSWTGGGLSELATYPLDAWEGMTIGAGVEGDTVTAYVGGAPVAVGEVDNPPTSEVGLYGFYVEHTGRSPEIGDFHVWDHIAGEWEGCLWTGKVIDIQSDAPVDGAKVATIVGEGGLTDAAKAGVASPRLAVGGAPSGLVVGDVLNRAGLLNPPGRIDQGTITTGPVGIADGKALDLARLAEETERGFLYETNEGPLAFADAAARATASPAAWFSDGPGQFSYHKIAPLDERSNVVNQVTAGVAADAPSGITITTVIGSGNVDITMPTVNDGDLLVVFIASSTNASGERWLTPLWWSSHRDAGTATGMRIYSHWCDGTEGGSTVIFYANAGAAAGLFIAAIVRIENWYQSPKGVAAGEPVSGFNPGALVHGWGRAPTLFLIVGTAIGSASTIDYSPDFDPPDGYGFADGNIVSSGTPATEAGIVFAYKIDCTEAEDPTVFQGLTKGLINESVVFAVRGYNGPHTKATLQDPNTTGGDGRFVTVADVASQDDHDAILPHRSPSILHATEAGAEAYGEAILAASGDQRPPVSISFYASKSAAYRRQAIRRRVGHMIHLTATGASTGLGIDDDEFIEQIGHRWSEGGCLWETTFVLSPA